MARFKFERYVTSRQKVKDGQTEKKLLSESIFLRRVCFIPIHIVRFGAELAEA